MQFNNHESLVLIEYKNITHLRQVVGDLNENKLEAFQIKMVQVNLKHMQLINTKKKINKNVMTIYSDHKLGLYNKKVNNARFQKFDHRHNLKNRDFNTTKIY